MSPAAFVTTIPQMAASASGTRLTRARVQLLLKHPFFGTLALHLTPVETQSVATAAVDGTHLFFHPEWIATLTDAELLFVTAHEVLHCVLDHLARVGGRDHELFNVACDYAVNLLLTDAGLTMPSCGLWDERFRGLSAEQIYKLLVKEGGCGSLRALDKILPLAGQNGYGSAGRAVSAEQMSTVWRRRTVQAATQARQAGTLPGDLSQIIDGLQEARLDWRTLLRRFLDPLARSDYRMLPPNRRHLYRGWYLPSLWGEYAHLVIALDTSGSVDDEQVRVFLSEVQGAMMQIADYRIDLVQCDAMIQRHQVYGPGEPLTTTVRGRGGTDFRPVFDWVEAQNLTPHALVYLTDGYGAFPVEPPPYPALWLMNSDVCAPWGEIVRLDDCED